MTASLRAPGQPARSAVAARLRRRRAGPCVQRVSAVRPGCSAGCARTNTCAPSSSQASAPPPIAAGGAVIVMTVLLPPPLLEAGAGSRGVCGCGRCVWGSAAAALCFAAAVWPARGLAARDLPPGKFLKAQAACRVAVPAEMRRAVQTAFSGKRASVASPTPAACSKRQSIQADLLRLPERRCRIQRAPAARQLHAVPAAPKQSSSLMPA